jgi:hypothetical protein
MVKEQLRALLHHAASTHHCTLIFHESIIQVGVAGGRFARFKPHVQRGGSGDEEVIVVLVGPESSLQLKVA